MAKKILYRYNPETDDYERDYPSLSSRLLGGLRYVSLGLVIGAGVFFALFYMFGSPTEANLRRENAALRSQYDILNRRLESALGVMENIQNRDDNFYRVMMQMDPLSRGQRFAGLDNEARYGKLSALSDQQLSLGLTRSMDLLDRQLYAQSISFDQLRKVAGEQQDKLYHIPSVLPIANHDFTVASGFGYRLDPVLGSTRFHPGLDLSAREGTPVRATADGTVSLAEYKGSFGNSVEIDHGYNYLTSYSNLSSIAVRNGDEVKRGDIIGEVGNTGKSSGPHLHYEVRFKGEAQDPVNYNFMGVSPEDFEKMIETAENAGHIMD